MFAPRPKQLVEQNLQLFNSVRHFGSLAPHVLSSNKGLAAMLAFCPTQQENVHRQAGLCHFYLRFFLPGHGSSPVNSARPPSSSKRTPNLSTSLSGRSSLSNQRSEIVVSEL